MSPEAIAYLFILALERGFPLAQQIYDAWKKEDPTLQDFQLLLQIPPPKDLSRVGS